MSSLISQTDLEKLYRKEIRQNGKSGIEEVLKRKRTTEEEHKKRKSIFLSHSHEDKTIVDKIGLLFNKVDTDIYIDWMDETMPKVTNRKTAELIKEKIRHCNKFLFLATYYGLRSKWCDWEIGVAYTMKEYKKLAILPIESRSGNWKGSEYLQLFPTMTFKEKTLDTIDVNEIKIIYDNDRIVTLEEWLKE